MAESYVNGAAREAGAAAEIAASRKEAKYADIDSRFVFEPIAMETLGVLNSSARLLLSDLGRRITNICICMPMLLIVWPKCTLAALHASLVSPVEYANETDIQTDRRRHTVALRFQLNIANVSQDYLFHKLTI